MKALPLIQRAVELDPSFASAYDELANIYGNTDEGRANARKAFELRDRVSEKEKLKITARYHQLVTLDLKKAVETLELMRQLFPLDSTTRNNLGIAYRRVGRLEEALSEEQENLRLAPGRAIAYATLATAYIMLDRFEEAKSVLNQAADRNLASRQIHVLLYDIAFAQQDAHALDQERSWLKANNPDDNRLQPEGQALEAAYYGKFGELRKAIEQGMERALSNSNKAAASDARDLQAKLEFLVGMEDQAKAHWNEAQKLNPSVEHYYLTSASGVDADPSVRSLVDERAKANPQDTILNFVTIPGHTAALELHARNDAKAVAIMETARPFERAHTDVIYLRGLAYLQMNSGREAAAEFQKLLDHPGLDIGDIDLPLSYVGAARGYALAGDVSKALKAYQDFLKLWKDADPDVPILIQAKQEYAKLPQ